MALSLSRCVSAALTGANSYNQQVRRISTPFRRFARFGGYGIESWHFGGITVVPCSLCYFPANGRPRFQLLLRCIVFSQSLVFDGQYFRGRRLDRPCGTARRVCAFGHKRRTANAQLFRDVYLSSAFRLAAVCTLRARYHASVGSKCHRRHCRTVQRPSNYWCTDFPTTVY